MKAVEAEIYFAWAHEVKHSVEPVELNGPQLPFVVDAGDDQDWTCQLPDGYDAAREMTPSTPPEIRVKCGARWVTAAAPTAGRTG